MSSLKLLPPGRPDPPASAETNPEAGPPMPELVYRTEKRSLTALGLAAITLTILTLPLAVVMFTGEIAFQLLCGAISLVPILPGAALLYLGLNARQPVAEALKLVAETERDQGAWLADMQAVDVDWLAGGDPQAAYWEARRVEAHVKANDQRVPLIKRGVLLLIVAGALLALSAALFVSSDLDVFLIFLSMPTLPAFYGAYFLMRGAVIKGQGEKNLEALREYIAKVDVWRQGGGKSEAGAGEMK